VNKIRLSKKLLLFSLILTTLTNIQISTIIVHADETAPEFDYVQKVAGEKYVFVMLGSVEDENIRKQYTQSGLYKNNGAREPIWTVDWYAGQVEISSDGIYLVRWGPWASEYNELALAFYKNGQEIKRYRVNELVAIPIKLPHSVSHFEWQENASFDAEQKLLWIRTLNKEEYTFDVTTGKIVKGIRAEPRITLVIGSIAVAMLIIIFAGAMLFRRIQSQKRIF
jgi:hypothetical protein